MIECLLERTASRMRRLRSGTGCTVTIAVITILPLPALAASGDLNCDGAINSVDIPLFVEALLATGSFGGCDISRADMNGDTRIDGRDAQLFVAALMQPTCAPPLTPCGGICVDTSYNNGNCGGCGIICLPDETCVGSICEPSQPCTDCANQ